LKAILHTQYGPPDLLQLEEVETPTPKDNEVLIAGEVKRAGKDVTTGPGPNT
jgi:NADPH:quinone reductase-like Zn-dependent oxidoreductase